MLSFEMRDAGKVVERLRQLEVIVLAESLGGVESLIEHPASMTHSSVPKEQREKQGITDGLVDSPSDSRMRRTCKKTYKGRWVDVYQPPPRGP